MDEEVHRLVAGIDAFCSLCACVVQVHMLHAVSRGRACERSRSIDRGSDQPEIAIQLLYIGHIGAVEGCRLSA